MVPEELRWIDMKISKQDYADSSSHPIRIPPGASTARVIDSPGTAASAVACPATACQAAAVTTTPLSGTGGDVCSDQSAQLVAATNRIAELEELLRCNLCCSMLLWFQRIRTMFRL